MIRLARLINHDPQSKNYPAETAPIKSVSWSHSGPVLDQGDIGSCTGNAAADCMNTAPLYDGKRPLLDERAAVAIYSWATHHDGFGGVYPPTDTGSSGLAAAKAVKSLGLIRSYRHAFGLEHALGALSRGPVMVGIPWYHSMFRPDAQGFIRPDGNVEGGHELAVIANNADKRFVTLLNSWGPDWGINGTAYVSWDDFGALLSDQGDCTVLIP